MQFKEWVNRAGGQTAVALKLKVTRQAVYNWIHGENAISWDLANRVAALSKGQLRAEKVMKETRQRKRVNK